MLYKQAMSIFLIFCMVAVCVVGGGLAHPLDITVGRQYFGSYISKLPGVLLPPRRRLSVTCNNAEETSSPPSSPRPREIAGTA